MTKKDTSVSFLGGTPVVTTEYTCNYMCGRNWPIDVTTWDYFIILRPNHVPVVVCPEIWKNGIEYVFQLLFFPSILSNSQAPFDNPPPLSQSCSKLSYNTNFTYNCLYYNITLLKFCYLSYDFLHVLPLFHASLIEIRLGVFWPLYIFRIFYFGLVF